MNKLLIAIVAIFTSGLANAGESLIRNGSFEEGNHYWTVHPHMQIIKESDQSGSTRLLSQSLPAPDDGYIHEIHTSQCINFGDARLFFLEAEFFYLEYPSKDHAHRLNHTWFDEEGCKGGGQYGGYLEPKQDKGWQSLIQDNIKPALNSRSVQINLTHNRRASERDLGSVQSAYYWLKELFGSDQKHRLSSGYWDNIALVATAFAEQTADNANVPHETTMPRGVNLLLNTDFSRDTKGWWKDSMAEWVGAQGNEAVGSLKVTRRSDEGSRGSLAFEQCVAVDGQPEFEFGGFFIRDETSTQTGGGRLRLVWYELPDCKGQSRISHAQVDPEYIPGWQHLHLPSVQTPQGAKSIKFQGIQSIAGPGEFIGYWDDLYLIVK